MTAAVDNEYLNHWDWLAPFWDVSRPEVEAEERFFVEEARAAGTSVLDLCCGTGRLSAAMAAAGFTVTGIDFSAAMLDHAQAKIARLPGEVRNRITLVQGDMRDFTLAQTFDSVTITWSFIYLLTPDDQRQALSCINRHLREGGLLIFSLPDPKLESIPVNPSQPGSPKRADAFVRPDNGHTVLVWVSTQYDLEQQTVEFLTLYEELDDDGRVVERIYKPLRMRFTLRQEMAYLLELCGFEVVALYGDHARSPFKPGGVQIWIARKRRPV